MSFSTISYVNGTPATFTYSSYIDSSSSILSYLTLGEGWTSITSSTFNRMLSLIAIKIPSSLTSIEESAFKDAVYLD